MVLREVHVAGSGDCPAEADCMAIEIVVRLVALLGLVPVAFGGMAAWFVVVGRSRSNRPRLVLPDLPGALDFGAEEVPWRWEAPEAA